MAFVANATADIDAQSQYKTIITICIVMSTLSLFIVGARLGIRTIHRSTATDDWMSLLSLLFAIAYSVLYGLGLPLSLRPKRNLITYTRVNYAGRPVYQLGISFFKIALLISYLRLLRGTDRKAYRTTIRLTIVFVSCSHLSTALLLLFSCNPIDKSWNPLKPGTCLPTGASFTAYAAVTIASDVLVTVLPIPILYALNIRLEKKVGLIGSFALGLFTTLCSILRYQQINRIQFGDGNSTMLVVWGVIEFHVGTVVSSLPFLAPICLRRAKGYGSRRSGSGSGVALPTGHGQGAFVRAEAVASGDARECIPRGSILVTNYVHVHDGEELSS